MSALAVSPRGGRSHYNRFQVGGCLDDVFPLEGRGVEVNHRRRVPQRFRATDRPRSVTSIRSPRRTRRTVAAAFCCN